MRASLAVVPLEQMQLSRAPHAEIAAAALGARAELGDNDADFIIVAVPPGSAGDAVDAINVALAE